MPRNASTAERTETIIYALTKYNLKAEARMEVYNNGQYYLIHDLDDGVGIDFTEGGRNQKIANFALTPISGEVSFSVVNELGKYSPGSGTAVEGFFDNDTKVRLKAGYKLPTAGTSTTTSLDLNDVSGPLVKSFFYKTESISSGLVQVDSDGPTSTTHLYDCTQGYGTALYGFSRYGPTAFYVATYDSEGIGYQNMTNISITSNNTDGKVYYRGVNASDSIDKSGFANWTYAGLTSNGTSNYSISVTNRFLQVCVLYDVTLATQQISDITITHAPYIEWVYKSVYYLDSPEFTEPSAPGIPLVVCEGRDAWKRALENDINIADLSGGVYLDSLIKDTCDQIGILYNSTSIASLSGFSQRVLDSGIDIKKAEDLFAMCMQIISSSGYQMWLQYDSVLDDNIMYVQLKPTTDTDGAFSYRNYEELGGTQRNYDKRLKRITVISDQNPVVAKSQLDTDTFSTTGSKSLSWSGEAEYKRLVISDPDNVTISNLVVNPTSITFDIDSISGSIDFTVEGNKWAGKIGSPSFNGTNDEDNDMSTSGRYIGGTNSTYEVEIDATGTPDTFKWRKDGGSYTTGINITGNKQTLENGIRINFRQTTGHTLADRWIFNTFVDGPDYEGEYFNYENMTNDKGVTSRLIIPLVISDAECYSIASSLTSLYGDPILEAKGLTWPYMNLLYTINDLMLLWRRYQFTDDLYYITTIKHHWDKDEDNTSFDLEDSGNDFSDLGSFIYDDIMDYDKGYLYDMGISSPLSTDAEIDAASTIVNNVGVTLDSYSVGDTGPGGGIVFYDKGSYGSGWRYLEAQTSDLSSAKAWSNLSSTLVGGTGSAIANGDINTFAIVQQSGHTDSAAKLCNDSTAGGVSNWYLPSLGELALMYTLRAIIGGFTLDAYWCSTEYDNDEAYTILFSNGLQANIVKTDTIDVRAIRKF
jgi:hypothetical protein